MSRSRSRRTAEENEYLPLSAAGRPRLSRRSTSEYEETAAVTSPSSGSAVGGGPPTEEPPPMPPPPVSSQSTILVQNHQYSCQMLISGVTINSNLVFPKISTIFKFLLYAFLIRKMSLLQMFFFCNSAPPTGKYGTTKVLPVR